MLVRRPNFRRLSAFTLLEVILALAILAGAIAVLGEVMSIAGRSAADAQAEAQAHLLAGSVMDEILTGMIDFNSQTRQSLETDSAIPWVYSATLGDTTLDGLTSVEVLVEQDIEKQFRPVKYRLLRWYSTESDEDGSEEDGSEEETDEEADEEADEETDEETEEDSDA